MGMEHLTKHELREIIRRKDQEIEELAILALIEAERAERLVIAERYIEQVQSHFRNRWSWQQVQAAVGPYPPLSERRRVAS